jgi:NAD(P)-dependent dehydrogenase (short-subunit alcohol dehydrogenase family)
VSTSLFDLTDKVAVVSGGAQGMGRSMAEAFAGAGAGAHLVLADLNLDGAEKTAESIRELRVKALAVRCDVSNPGDIDRLYEAVDNEFGRVDILSNVAGEGVLCDPLELELDVLEKVMWNLAIGRFYMTQQAGKRMLGAGRGSIMSLGSIASFQALGRGHIAYSMAMGAVVTMTRELSTEWSGKGVRVNAILPAQTTNPGLCIPSDVEGENALPTGRNRLGS